MQTALRIINIIVLAASPAAIAIMLLTSGISYPWWARGIFISWAMTINMWMLLGVLSKLRHTNLATFTFTFLTFVFPVGYGLILGFDLWLTAIETLSYHFLIVSVATVVTVLVKIFADDTDKRLLSMRLKLVKGEVLKKRMTKGFFGLLLFGTTLTLPAIATEQLFLGLVSESLTDVNSLWLAHEAIWLTIRYIGGLFEAFIVFRILFGELVLD